MMHVLEAQNLHFKAAVAIRMPNRTPIPHPTGTNQ